MRLHLCVFLIGVLGSGLSFGASKCDGVGRWFSWFGKDETPERLEDLFSISKPKPFSRRQERAIKRQRQVALNVGLRRSVELFDTITRRPVILMASMELGPVSFLEDAKGRPLKIFVGGMGAVMSDLMEEFPKFLATHDGHGQISFATMLYDGIPTAQLTFVTDFEIRVGWPIYLSDVLKNIQEGKGGIWHRYLKDFRRKVRPDAEVYPYLMDGSNASEGTSLKAKPTQKPLPAELDAVVVVEPRAETVKVYRVMHPSGAWIYFLAHPLFHGRSVVDNRPDVDIYVNQAVRPFPKGKKDIADYIGTWDEALETALFNQALAELHEYVGANVFMGHDNHVGLTPFYIRQVKLRNATKPYVEKPDFVAMTVIHNGAYQGIFKTSGYGNDRKGIPEMPGVVLPSGNSGANRQFLSMINLPPEYYFGFFEFKGTFNRLGGVLKYTGQRELIGGVPVSKGYARDLNMSRWEIEKTILSQKGRPPKKPDDVYIPNMDLTPLEKALLVGVENGKSLNEHASRHQDLRRVEDPDQLHPMITHPEVRDAFLSRDLTFGFDLHSEKGIKQTLEAKAERKRLLQLNSFGAVDPNKVVFGIVSRLVEQKNLGAFLNEKTVEYIVNNGGQIIVGGAPGDATGQKIAELLKRFEKKYPDSVKYYEGFVSTHIRALIFSGADFAVIPSRFEPCCVVDLEALMMGAIPVVKKTGGLVKTHNSFKVGFLDSSDPEGEADAFLKVVQGVMETAQNDPEFIDKTRIDGMKEQFLWKTSLARYMQVIQTQAIYHYIFHLQRHVSLGTITLEKACKDARRYVFKERAQYAKVFINILSHKQESELTPIERDLLAAADQ